MTIDTQAIKTLLQRETLENESDEQSLCRADNKLNAILQEATADDSETVELIRAYAESDETNRRKLLAYCENFVDPTCRDELAAQGTQIVLHTYLQKNDLYKLIDFINIHRQDTAFGEAVYKLMDRHGMTAPQVYKNAMLRRQDFARATSFGGGYNVTKRVAWQIIIGLHCNIKEADKVLFSAGYLRRKNELDLIMEYFIDNKNYDIVAINAVLADLNLKEFPCYEAKRRGDLSIK